MVLIYAVAGSRCSRAVFGEDLTLASDALPWLGLAMVLLACTYLSVQYLLALHRYRFIWILAAGVAEVIGAGGRWRRSLPRGDGPDGGSGGLRRRGAVPGAGAPAAPTPCPPPRWQNRRRERALSASELANRVAPWTAPTSLISTSSTARRRGARCSACCPTLGPSRAAGALLGCGAGRTLRHCSRGAAGRGVGCRHRFAGASIGSSGLCARPCTSGCRGRRRRSVRARDLRSDCALSVFTHLTDSSIPGSLSFTVCSGPGAAGWRPTWTAGPRRS